MVGDLEKSSFSNIEQQSLEFVKYTLDPAGFKVGAEHGSFSCYLRRKNRIILSSLMWMDFFVVTIRAV